MKLTKYEHACFTIEKDGKLIVVDPGAFTSDLPALESVVGVVITHNHPDHCDPAALSAIVSHNPDAVIYADGSITQQLGDTLSAKSVSAGQLVNNGPFTLEFFGGEHAVIHPDIPVAVNLGVMINDNLYYPGDSFTLPGRAVDTLALPTAAPWLKISETLDFLLAVKPKLAFPTHDAISSDQGKSLADRMIPTFAEKAGCRYERLNGPIEING